METMEWSPTGAADGWPGCQGWEALPCSVFSLLLDQLGPSSYASMRAVCRGWRTDTSRALQKLRPPTMVPCGWEACFPNLTHLDWSRCICPVTDTNMAQISQLTQLRSLNCAPHETTKPLSTLTDMGLAALQSLPELTSLDLSSCRLITDRGLQELCHSPLRHKLKLLRLINCHQLTDHGISSLQTLSALRSLSLFGLKEVTGTSMQVISQLPLEVLDLRLCKRVGNDCLCLLSSPGSPLAASLKHLDLTGCDTITDHGASFLGRMKSLVELQLNACRGLSDEPLEALAQNPRLQVLGVSMWRGLTGDGFLTFPPGVTDLNVSWCPEFRSLSNLSSLAPNLRCLTADRSGLSDLAHLLPGFSLPALERLSLAGCCNLRLGPGSHLEDALRRMPSLTFLDLSDNPHMTNQALAALLSATQLTALNLLRCKGITDEGLEMLSGLPQLQLLNIIGCNKITAGALQHLMLKRGANLVVRHSHNLLPKAA